MSGDYAGGIVKMYIRSLGDNQNLRGVFQEELNTALQSKDKAIQDLQG